VVKHLKPARRDEKFLQVARRLFHTEAEILEKLGIILRFLGCWLILKKKLNFT
jgi:hypothetical protein